MITFLQRSLQRHYKWLFSIMLVVITVAFVFTIGATPGIGESERKGTDAYFYGVNLGNQAEVQEWIKRCNISFYMDTGKGIPNDQMGQSLLLSRIVLLELADELQIPQPNEDDLVGFIREKALFRGGDGAFQKHLYDAFLLTVKGSTQMEEGEVKGIIEEDYRATQALKAVAGPGYVLPAEAKLSIERQEALWSVVVAQLKGERVAGEGLVNEEALEQFFRLNKENYQTAEKVNVAYVMFESARYEERVGDATEEELERFFDSNLPTFVGDFGEGVTPDYKLVKNKVVREYRKKRAHRLAAEAANDFVYALYERNIEYGTQAFTELLVKHGVKLQAVAPYALGERPEGAVLSDALLREAFLLDQNKYYSDPGSVDGGYAMLFFRGKIGAEIPTLDDVRTEVTERYLTSERKKLLEVKAKMLSKRFRNGVKLGKDFAELARGEGLEVETFNGFKLQDAPGGMNQSLLPELVAMQEGGISEGLARGEDLYFLYVKGRENVEIGEEDPRLKELQQRVRPATMTAAGNAVLQELIRKELMRLEESKG